jgi:hypothetical protein
MNMHVKSQRWELIARDVAHKHGLAYSDLLQSQNVQPKSRRYLRAGLIELRWRLRDELRFSWAQIARLTGVKDHTTAMYSAICFAAKNGNTEAIEYLAKRNQRQKKYWKEIGSKVKRKYYWRGRKYGNFMALRGHAVVKNRISADWAIKALFRIDGLHIVYFHRPNKTYSIRGNDEISFHDVKRGARSMAWFLLTGQWPKPGQRVEFIWRGSLDASLVINGLSAKTEARYLGRVK